MYLLVSLRKYGIKVALIYSIENSPTIVGAISATLMMVSQAD
jgi:hypothetical protein